MGRIFLPGFYLLFSYVETVHKKMGKASAFGIEHKKWHRNLLYERIDMDEKVQPTDDATIDSYYGSEWDYLYGKVRPNKPAQFSHKKRPIMGKVVRDKRTQ